MTDQRFCSQCGAAIRLSAKFCNNCGATLTTPVHSPTQVRAESNPSPVSSPAAQTPTLGRRLLGVSGCLFSGGLVLVALVLAALIWWSNTLAQASSPVSAPRDLASPTTLVAVRDDKPTAVTRPTPDVTAPVLAATMAPSPTDIPEPPAATVAPPPTDIPEPPTLPPTLPTNVPPALVPAEIIGNWVTSNQLGALGYSFFADGRFERAVRSVVSDENCTSTFEKFESGTATFDNGMVTLTIAGGDRHVSDTCGRDERTTVETQVEQYPWYLNGAALNIDNTDYVRYQ